MLVLATATPREMKAVLAGFGERATVEQGSPVPLELRGRSVLLVVTGVGVVNAALAAGMLLGREDVDGVVNIGVAGAFDPETHPLGSAHAVDCEIWPEYGLLLPDGTIDPRGIGFAQARLDSGPVWDRVALDPEGDARRMGLCLSEAWGRGASLTVSCVSGTSERAAGLGRKYGAALENMEGFGLAYACAVRGVPFLEVRTVSNVVGSRREEDWALNRAVAALGPCAHALIT